MSKCGFRKDENLRPYQSFIRDEIFEDLQDGYQNFFISFPQGAGKTVIALASLAKLINEGIVKESLVILPRKVLVDQWVEEAEKMFYGLNLVKYTPERGVSKSLRKLRYSGAVGVAMTAHSFKSKVEKRELQDYMFDAVLVDEASDLVPAKDFFEKYRLSSYIKGLETWEIIKLFTQPHEVEEEKMDKMVSRFGEDKTKVIHRTESEISIKELNYEVCDTIVVQDPKAESFTTALDERRREARRNIHMALDQLNVKGYRENLETILLPSTASRLQKTYNISNEELESLQNLTRTYILNRHINRWFLYCNRPEIGRTILSDQKTVKEWLNSPDKKLQKLTNEVKSHLKEDEQVYIFSKYINTARQIKRFLVESLDIVSNKVYVITGQDDKDQFVQLDDFQKNGDILIATPVFDMGTDIPSADVIFVFTPPFNREQLHQVVKRIRGGEIKFIAYDGKEKESIDNLVGYLQDYLSGQTVVQD